MKPTVRKGQAEVKLSKDEFVRRFAKLFFDPQFASVQQQIDDVTEVAWSNYQAGHKAPRTVKAGPGFQDPQYDLSIEWLEARQRLELAEEKRKSGPSRILVICGSPRNEHTCPSEESKTHRLVEKALAVIKQEAGFETDFLDLSRLTAEYGKVIHPCKACVSTAMPLCHWPCSCYPNHGLGQAPDWMNDIYEQWMAAHGVMILTPVHWYQAPTVLKLMMDRLVCADGGNADPTSTQGKDPLLAKEMELKGWDYPKHLAGRAFSVVVHGDSAGTENLRRILIDWLTDMKLIPAGASSQIGEYIGYYKPYATSHEDLDEDQDLFKEVENAATSLVNQIRLIRSGHFTAPDENLKDPRQK